jgi:arabinogalactan oligomer/maltooligosaccharide transport system substrate-binding protein
MEVSLKRISVVIIALLLLLASCMELELAVPSPDVSADPDDPVLTRREITITVWTDPGGCVEFINQAAAAFNRRWPNITIRAEGVNPADMAPRVWAESARGGCADLFMVTHMEIKALAESQLILPARDQTGTKNAVFPVCAQAATVNGIIYGYPVTADTVALFFNRDLVEAGNHPITWDGTIQFIRDFQRDGHVAFVTQLTSAHTTAPFLSAKQNRPFGPNGDDLSALNLETAGAQEGMDLFRRLGRAAGIPSHELEDAEGLFASGRAALCLAGSWNISRFVQAGVNFGVTPLHPMPGEDYSLASLAVTRVMAVSAFSGQPDEASAFAAFLLTEEMQRLRMRLTGELPSIDMEGASPYYMDGFIRQLSAAYSAPAIPEAGRYWEVFIKTADLIWDGADVNSSLAAAAAELRSDFSDSAE